MDFVEWEGRESESSPPSPAAGRGNWQRATVWNLLSLALLLAVALPAVRLRQSVALDDPFWLDEWHTLWVVDGQTGSLAARAAAGNQTPFYSRLIAGVSHFFPAGGLNDRLRLRMPSVIFSGMLIVLAGWLVWRVGRSLPGAMLAAGLLACNETQHFYGSEARPYMLLALAGLAQSALFAVMLVHGLRPHERGEHAGLAGRSRHLSGMAALLLSWLGLGLLSWVVMQVHPTGVLLVGAELLLLAGCGVWSVAGTWATRRQHGGRREVAVDRAGVCGSLGAAVVFGAGLAVAMWGPLLLQLLKNRGDWSVVVEPWTTFLDIAAPAALALLAALASLVTHSWRERTGRKETVAGVAGVLAGLAVLVALVVQVSNWLGLAPLALPRYQAAVWGLLPVATGLFVALVPWLWMETVLAFGLFLLAVRVPISTPGSGIGPWRTMAGNVWDEPLFERSLSLRNENWDAVQKALNGVAAPRRSAPAGPPGVPGFGRGQIPVFLLANLIEDSRLEPDGRNGRVIIAPGVSMEDYCRFPLWPSLAGGHLEVRPRRTLQGPRFGTDDIQRLAEERFGFLVVRGSNQVLREAISELDALAKANGLALSAPKFDSADSSVVKIKLLVVRQRELGVAPD